MNTMKLLLGGHISIAGGLHEALVRGESINCTAIQIFTRSNRQWAAKKLTQEDIDLFAAAWKKTDIATVVVHLPYLINIGSPQATTRHASMSIIKQELERCNALGIDSMVLHPGSHLGHGEDLCIEHIITSLNDLLADDTGTTKILLENMAGQGTNVGYTFAQLATMMKGVTKKNRLGICFDTCHAFAAGYDLRTPKAYEAVWEEFDRVIGLSHLKVIHLNDSKKELGSRVDRHEEIGDGKIGLGGFRLLMNDERLLGIPKILETPEGTLESYVKNMDLLKGLLTTHTKKALGL